MSLENIIGHTGRNISDFYLYNTQQISFNDIDYRICCVMVDGQYIAFLVKDDIIMSEITHTRNLGNLYISLFEKTGMQIYEQFADLEEETENNEM